MFEQVSGFFVPIIILLSLASVSSILISVFKLKFLPTFAVEILIGLVIAHWFNADMAAGVYGSCRWNICFRLFDDDVFKRI